MRITFQQAWDAYHKAESFDDVGADQFTEGLYEAADEAFDQLGQMHPIDMITLSAKEHAECIVSAFKGCNDLKRGRELLSELESMKAKLKPEGALARITGLFSSRSEDYELIHAAIEQAKASLGQMALKQEKAELTQKLQEQGEFLRDIFRRVKQDPEGAVIYLEDTMAHIPEAELKELIPTAKKGGERSIEEFAVDLYHLKPHHDQLREKRGWIEEQLKDVPNGSQILTAIQTGEGNFDEIDIKTVLRIVTQFIAPEKSHILELIRQNQEVIGSLNTWSALAIDEPYGAIAGALQQAAGQVAGQNAQDGMEKLMRCETKDIKKAIQLMGQKGGTPRGKS